MSSMDEVQMMQALRGLLSDCNGAAEEAKEADQLEVALAYRGVATRLAEILASGDGDGAQRRRQEPR